MKHKTIIPIIFGMILLIGVVTAGEIIPVEPWDLGKMSFIAGGTTSTEFSFDYPDVEVNYNNAPLVAKINVASLNLDYPVGKGDFQFSMVAEQYWLPFIFGNSFPINTIPMQCKEDAPIQFKAKDKSEIQYTINEIPDGIFYCYNPNYYMMQLDSHDDITLSISSNPALYPGEYSVEVELMEMEPDYKGPIIELIGPLGDEIYSGEDTILIKLNITDMYNIDDSSVRYKLVSLNLPAEGQGLLPEESNEIIYDSGWITATFNKSSEFYEDSFEIPNSELIDSGLYWIYAEAKDILGNEGKL